MTRRLAEIGGRPGDPRRAARAGGSDAPPVVVTGASESEFPEIAVHFEVQRPDGSFLLDATRDDFRVTEDGQDVPILRFQAPSRPEASGRRRSSWSSTAAGAWRKRTGSAALKRGGRDVPGGAARGLAGRGRRVRLGGRADLPVHRATASGSGTPVDAPDARRGDPLLRRGGRGPRAARAASRAAAPCWP